jgi:hypothetical protein
MTTDTHILNELREIRRVLDDETPTPAEESLREIITVLRGIEGMLDILCSTVDRIEDDTADLCYHKLHFWQRWRLAWQRARFITELTEAEGEAYRK